MILRRSIVRSFYILVFFAEVEAMGVCRFFRLTNNTAVATFTAATTPTTVIRVYMGGEIWGVGGVTGDPVTFTQPFIRAG